MNLIIFVITFLIYSITSPGETPFNYFSRLSEAFANSRNYITAVDVPHLNELIPIGENNYYVPYAPFPAIFLTPFTFLTKTIPNQTLFSIFAGSLLAFVTFEIAILVTKEKSAAIFIAILASFGTNLWYNSIVGSSWYFAQVIACLFLSLAILAKLHSKNNFMVGLFLGAAYLSRPHIILSLPFFIFLNKKVENKKVFQLFLGIIPFLLLNFFYNYSRFGVIWDKGYTLIPGVLEEPWYELGIFHPSYISRHLDTILFLMPDKVAQFPYLVPSPAGMALWLTTPAFIILFFTNFKERTVKLALLASLLIFIPISMHGTTGFSQFGYRFAIDFYPFWFLVIAYALKKRFRSFYWVLLGVSVLINFWGVMYG